MRSLRIVHPSGRTTNKSVIRGYGWHRCTDVLPKGVTFHRWSLGFRQFSFNLIAQALQGHSITSSSIPRFTPTASSRDMLLSPRPFGSRLVVHLGVLYPELRSPLVAILSVRDAAHGFPITGLFSHTSPCHWHSIVCDYSLTGLDTCTVRVGIYAHASPVCDSRSIEGCFSPAPVSSRAPSPCQHIPGITLGIGFLGDPSRQGIRPGRLLPLLGEPLTGYSVPCVHFP